MVSRGNFDFDGEEWDDISADAKDLINKLITRPERRLTASEALQHRFMRTHTHQSTAETRSIIKRLNIGNIKQFNKSEKLKQVALMAIAV